MNVDGSTIDSAPFMKSVICFSPCLRTITELRFRTLSKGSTCSRSYTVCNAVSHRTRLVRTKRSQPYARTPRTPRTGTGEGTDDRSTPRNHVCGADNDFRRRAHGEGTADGALREKGAKQESAAHTSPYPLTSTFIVSPKALLSFSRNLKPTFLAAITRASSSGLAPLYLRILGSFSSTSTSTVWFRASDVKNSLIASDSDFGCSSGGGLHPKCVRACVRACVQRSAAQLS